MAATNKAGSRFTLLYRVMSRDIPVASLKQLEKKDNSKKVPNSDGLQTNSDGLQRKSDGLQLKPIWVPTERRICIDISNLALKNGLVLEHVLQNV